MIVKFIEATGEIICAGSLKIEEIQKTLKSGETVAVYAGNVRPDPISDYWFKNGEFVKKVDSELKASNFAELRRNEYPPIGDQLDAIWKGGSDFDAMKVRVDAVKAKYPKA